jgi:hypothetical protein
MDAETIAAHKAHSTYVAGIPPRPGFAWIEGAPPRPWNQEWFFAQMRNGQCITLKAREGDHDYNYTTADETYWAGGRIARWMQIPDTEFVPFCPASAPPEERREDDCQLRMGPKAELTVVLEDLKTRDQSIKDLHAACDAKTAYGKHQEEIKNRALRLLWTVQSRFSSKSYETFRTLQGELEEFLNEVDEDQECYPMTYAPTEPADLPATEPKARRPLCYCPCHDSGMPHTGEPCCEDAILPTLPYQAEAIAHEEMAERLRVAEAEAERLRARTTELAAVRGGAVLRPMEIAPKTGEHIIVVGDLTGIGFGWSGPNRSRQSWADVVHWYGWEEGGEPSGWYSSSYGGEEQQRPFEQPLRGWLPIPETGLLANPRMAVMCMEESDGDGTRTYMGEAPVYSVQTMPAPTPEGKVLVDAGELAVLESLKVEEFVEICQEYGTDVRRCKAITELFRSRLRSAVPGQGSEAGGGEG